jgi:UDP-N-acetylglucosamine 4,6-dehydratase
VEHAFGHGRKGEVLVPKVPACTIRTLVDALGDVFEVKPVVEVIGVRHGEKMAETLATGEELRRSTDMGDYLRIGLDERDLDYTPYVDRGARDGPPQDDYTSENTRQLDRDETAALLQTLPEIQRELGPMVTA